MNTQSHLDLEELLAEADGEALTDQAREHLAACALCHAEAARWDTVAGGVRAVMSAVPETTRPSPRLLVRAARKRRTVMAAGAAAGLLLIGGASYALTRPAPAAPEATLTAVSGCAGLKEASGTLEQVNGTSVVIKTASGRPVTVTTSASTRISAFAAPLSDITDGASVVVMGHRSGGTIAAQHVVIGNPFRKGKGKLTIPPGLASAQGTVQDARPGAFTVVTSDGTRVPVTTSSQTKVTLLRASLTQLKPGAFTLAIGQLAPDGTLQAMGVSQPPNRNVRYVFQGCTPASIGTAITMALIAAG
jgi:hypothetical protein